MREALDFCLAMLAGQNPKPKLSKKLLLSSMPTDGRWSFLHFRSRTQNANCAVWVPTGSGNRGDPMGTGCSRGTRPCLHGLVCYTFCDREAREGMTHCFRRHRLPGCGQQAVSACAQAETGGCPQEDGAKSSSGDKREDFVPAGPQEGYKIPRPRRSGQDVISNNSRSG